MQKLSTSQQTQQSPLAWQAFNLDVRLSAASAWKGDDRERYRGRWTGRNVDAVVVELYTLEGQQGDNCRIKATALLPDWLLERAGVTPRTFAARCK